MLEWLGVTVLCQAPTEYRLMAKLDTLGSRPLQSLRHAVSAGEPLNPEVIARFRDALGVTIYDGYGQTENTLLVANSPDRAVRPGSMGWPTPGHHVAVIDEEENEVADGVEGDIALYGRPPSLFMRYWKAPDETGLAFRGSWYVTGDRGARDEDGSIWFMGRADDVILSAAYRIGPFEVESALLEHPAVAESAAVGKPDSDRGEIVKAFVVLRPGHDPSSELAAELQEHAKRVTAPYKYPREIEFVTELPKTRSGKIRRVELRRLELTRAGLAPPQPSGEEATDAPPEDETPALVVVSEVDEAATRFLREAAVRKLAEDERQQTQAEELRLARQAEQEQARQMLELQEHERRAEQRQELEEATRTAGEELERRRREDEARWALGEAEQRRRAEQRLADEADAHRRRERRWRELDPEEPAGGPGASQRSPLGAGVRRNRPGGRGAR